MFLVVAKESAMRTYLLFVCDADDVHDYFMSRA